MGSRGERAVPFSVFDGHCSISCTGRLSIFERGRSLLTPLAPLACCALRAAAALASVYGRRAHGARPGGGPSIAIRFRFRLSRVEWLSGTGPGIRRRRRRGRWGRRQLVIYCRAAGRVWGDDCALLAQAGPRTEDYCSSWCNGPRWDCGRNTHANITCDCAGCSGCPMDGNKSRTPRPVRGFQMLRNTCAPLPRRAIRSAEYVGNTDTVLSPVLR